MDLEKEDLSTRLLQLDGGWKQKKKNECAKFHFSIYKYCGKVLPLFSCSFAVYHTVSHSFVTDFWPKFWAESAGPKFGLPEKIPSPRVRFKLFLKFKNQ